MHIVLLMVAVIFASCGYFLSLPVLTILTILILLGFIGGPSRNSEVDGMASLLSAGLNFLVLVCLLIMWAVALVVRGEVVWQLLLNLKELIFR